MIIFKHKVRDTVTLNVEIDNLSSNASNIKLTLYRKNMAQGLSDKIKEVSPQSIDGNKITFVYNTNDFLTRPTTYYGWFTINNNGVIINTYYKIKAQY